MEARAWCLLLTLANAAVAAFAEGSNIFPLDAILKVESNRLFCVIICIAMSATDMELERAALCIYFDINYSEMLIYLIILLLWFSKSWCRDFFECDIWFRLSSSKVTGLVHFQIWLYQRKRGFI